MFDVRDDCPFGSGFYLCVDRTKSTYDGADLFDDNLKVLEVDMVIGDEYDFVAAMEKIRELLSYCKKLYKMTFATSRVHGSFLSEVEDHLKQIVEEVEKEDAQAGGCRHLGTGERSKALLAVQEGRLRSVAQGESLLICMV